MPFKPRKRRDYPFRGRQVGWPSGAAARGSLPIPAGDRAAAETIGLMPGSGFSGTVATPSGVENVALDLDDSASDVRAQLGRRDQTMDDGQAKKPVKDTRQQRLKQALRENLKRRKAQARQRKPGEAAPLGLHETALDDDPGKRDE
jgi:hypothetical protein